MFNVFNAALVMSPPVNAVEYSCIASKYNISKSFALPASSGFLSSSGVTVLNPIILSAKTGLSPRYLPPTAYSDARPALVRSCNAVS